MVENNQNIIRKDGGLYNIGMKRLISVESYSDTFVIPEGVEFIAECAFWKCEKLKQVVIPNSVVDIGTSAFAGCKSLIEVIIPDSVDRIGPDAFAYCDSLEKVTIPSSLTFMGGSAFLGCYSLKQIIYRNLNFKVEDILPNVIKANEYLFLDISNPGYFIPLVIDVVLRLIWKNNYDGFFKLSADYKVNTAESNIYY